MLNLRQIWYLVEFEGQRLPRWPILVRMYILTTEYRLQFYSITQKDSYSYWYFFSTDYRDNGVELSAGYVLFKSCAVADIPGVQP